MAIYQITQELEHGLHDIRYSAPQTPDLVFLSDALGSVKWHKRCTKQKITI